MKHKFVKFIVCVSYRFFCTKKDATGVKSDSERASGTLALIGGIPLSVAYCPNRLNEKKLDVNVSGSFENILEEKGSNLKSDISS